MGRSSASPPKTRHFTDLFMTTLLFVAVAYLLGSLSFAVIVSRAMRLPDPRSFGSGNPGATNVLRSGRKTAAALTLLGDALKGWVAVVLARMLAPQFGLLDDIVLLCALAVFIGHLFPVFFRFQGGKGVATALGVLLGVSGWLALATLATWLIIVAFFRWVSFASLIAAAFAPFFYLLAGGVAWDVHPGVGLAIAVMAGLLAWRHQANIRRLIQGKEPRLGGEKRRA